MVEVIALFIAVAVESVALYAIVKPRPKADAPTSALRHIARALELLPHAKTHRDFRKLHALTARAQERVERARMDDVYDLDGVYDRLASVKRVFWAVVTARPASVASYVRYATDALQTCKNALIAAAGISESAQQKRYAPYASRAARAKALLESLPASDEKKLLDGLPAPDEGGTDASPSSQKEEKNRADISGQ